MVTSYVISIGKQVYDVPESDLKNWQDIKCTYKRVDLDGLIRTFSSEFVFCGHTCRILWENYLKSGVDTEANISAFSIDENWRRHLMFSCALDFSSLNFDGYSLKMNCVDDSISSKIKALKSTTYEFVIDKDIIQDKQLYYNRLPILENVLFKMTKGQSFDDKADFIVELERGKRLFMGECGNEILVNGSVFWNDDQTDEDDGFLLKAVKPITLSVDIDIKYNASRSLVGLPFYACIDVNGVITRTYKLFAIDDVTYAKDPIGTYLTFEDLIAAHPYPVRNDMWARVGGLVVVALHGQWSETNSREIEFFTKRRNVHLEFDMEEGEKLIIATDESGKNKTSGQVYIYTQSFRFGWHARGEACNVKMFYPQTVCQKLVDKILEGTKHRLDVEISDYDSRMECVRLIAGESLRGFADAKLYTSFSDFCGWMSAVFGYTYRIVSEQVDWTTVSYAGQNTRDISIYDTIKDEYPPIDESEIDTDCIVIDMNFPFFYYLYEGKYYTQWPGWEYYNTDDGNVRADRWFSIEREGQRELFKFIDGKYRRPQNKIQFIHRTELYGDTGIVNIENAREFSFTVSNNNLYSSLDIGYPSKSYDNQNGRYEFNFNHEYTIDTPHTDKTLTLQSKYRADCYGFEFAVIKRSEETKDSSSDKDVFFVSAGNLYGGDVEVLRYRDLYDQIHRVNYTGGATSDMFNGEFSPVECVMANKEYIAMQHTPLKLTFASSKGFSDILIDNKPLTSDIVIEDALFMAAEASFKSDFVLPMEYWERMLAVEHNGTRYVGFLSQMQYFPAYEKTVEYKIIVKEITPC